MDNIINTLKDTPLPNILVVAGILFLLLAVANQFMGKITIAPDKQKLAGMIGALLLILGIALQVIPPQVVSTNGDSFINIQVKPTPDVSGTWKSNFGLIYEVRQDGNSFSWVVTEPINEKAHGEIDGNIIKASWTGDLGAGSATGEITKTDSAERAVQVEWPNGVTFSRINEKIFTEQYMENTNLLWGDLGPAIGNDPSDCEQACNNNKQCLSWTWVRQGALPLIPRDNLSSFCALKNSTDLQKVQDTCCVSGYKYIENTNLLWGDIGPVIGSEPSDCEQACNNNKQCLSWTWVRQGALPLIHRENLAPFCALKNSKDLQKIQDSCCVSGYKR